MVEGWRVTFTKGGRATRRRSSRILLDRGDLFVRQAVGAALTREMARDRGNPAVAASVDTGDVGIPQLADPIGIAAKGKDAESANLVDGGLFEDIQGRAKQQVHADGAELAPDDFADLGCQRRIPGRAHRHLGGQRRKAAPQRGARQVIACLVHADEEGEIAGCTPVSAGRYFRPRGGQGARGIGSNACSGGSNRP